jgi:hypothetical protein
MAASRTCPICQRRLPEGAEGARFAPFCSKRCADVDLGRWLTGSYAIPVASGEDEGESASGPAQEDGESGPSRH